MSGGQDGQDATAGGFVGDVSATGEGFSVQAWHWFSHDQAIAATTFARKCGELEADLKTPSDDERARGLTWSTENQQEHRSYVTASILSSVTFLEANINELFASASHPNLEVGGDLPTSERNILIGAADMISNNRLLDRFQLALYLLNKKPFDPGTDQSYQDAKVLVSLRNDLVHYKPRFRKLGAGSSESAKWAKTLAQKHFSLNPFTGSGNPFFPDKCLSYGCAVWVWNAALSFADDFFTRVGVQPIYGNIRQSLAL